MAKVGNSKTRARKKKPPMDFTLSSADILKMAMAKAPADRYQAAGGMYEALLAFLYAQGSRYGAHDLAEFLAKFREYSEVVVAGSPPLEAEADHAGEQTPVEIPAARPTSTVRPTGASSHAAIERAAEMGERREVTAS